MLFLAGATNRLTRVDEGNTVTDFDDEEIQRKITISTALAYVEWNKLKINLLDTPGFNIFINDTKAALVAADSSLVLVDGVAGVEVQTEKVWSFAAEFKLPRALVINKLDRENSSFERALASIQENFGRGAVPIQLPCGAERDFRGVIDLVRMKCFTYESGRQRPRQGRAHPAEPGRGGAEGPGSPHRDGGRGQRRPDGGVLREGHACRRSACRGPADRRPRDAAVPGAVRHRSEQHRHRPDPGSHRRLLPVPRRTRPRRRRAGRAGSPAGGLRLRAGLGLRLQDRRRPVRRPRELFQGAAPAC